MDREMEATINIDDEENADWLHRARRDDRARLASSVLGDSAQICLARDAEARVPKKIPGLYAIFVNRADYLPAKFLPDRNNCLLYVGIATKSLHERLVRQDLRHRRPSSFFRSLGGILGRRPVPGSLAGKRNRNNFRFSDADEAKILGWIYGHLWVSWLCKRGRLGEIERSIIRRCLPPLNITHHPKPLDELKRVRAECRAIATLKSH